MVEFWNSIFNTLVDTNGSMVYYLILSFCLASALQASFVHWRSSEFPQAKRTNLALGLLLGAHVAHVLLSNLALQGLINIHLLLPPLDRATTLFMLVCMLWMWVFPEPTRIADVVAGVVGVLVWVGLALNLVVYAQEGLTPFNLTIYDGLWQLAGIAVALFGLILLFVRRPNGWGNGVLVFSLAFAGHLLHMMIGRESGDYAGAVRLAYMAGSLFLMTLPHRFPSASSSTGAMTSVKQHAPVDERRRYSTDPKTFHALLSLAGESSTEKLSEALTRATAQTMLADLCFLLYLTDNKNQIHIASGYDLIREEKLEGGSLNKSLIPMLTNALQRGRPLRLPASSTSADIKGLSDMLGLTNPGHIMSVPIVTPEKDVIGGVLLLSPYSNRLWSAEDQAFLANIATSLVPIIQRGQKMNALEQKGEQTRQALDVAQMRINDLERANADLLKQMDAVRLDAQQGLAKGEELAEMTRMQAETQKVIERLKEENENLRVSKVVKSNNTTNANNQQMEGELRLMLEETARLQNQLAQASMRIAELEKGSASAQSNEQAEVVASISQELRQPMSSIVGYTDLLLGESVGILGALQRKFVERIKGSIERIENLINDLIQITTLETGLNDLKPEPVDLNTIIDNAMAYTSSQVREKNISLQLDLPKNMAPISADREALQQILIHLLQNAGAASPVEGTVRLKVQTHTEGDNDYVLIQVSDTGGGIPANELSRVFTRLYRADNVLIQGVGDTGVGLSITKTLTEAQKGRIWVETEAGIGSTFSVLLPLANKNLPTRATER